MGAKLYASSFTLVELYNAICRKIIREGRWRLIDPLQNYAEIYKNPEEKCRFLSSMITSFLRERLDVEFVDYEKFYRLTTVNFDNVKIPKVFEEAIKLSPKIAIRIKDLLHLTYAHMLTNIHNIRYFLTHDVEDFGKVKNLVEQLLDIKVTLVK